MGSTSKQSWTIYTPARSTSKISWLWDGGIDVKLGGIKVKLGDELNDYKAEGKVSTMHEVSVWLRDQACQHYPDSGFAQKYCGFV